MSNKITTKNAAKKTPIWVWFLALVPIISTVLYIVLLSGSIPFIKAEVFHFTGAIVFMLAVAGWGACGFAYAYNGVELKKAIFAANIIPMLCAVIYTVTLFFTGLEAEALSDFALYISLGMGLFSYVDVFLYEVFSIGVFGLYVDLICILATFVIGYTLGKAKKLKVK
jgi:hypothetical protein